MNDPITPSPSRRAMLKSLGLGALALGAKPALSLAQSQDNTARPRNPSIYAFTIGELEAWSISDGHLTFTQGLEIMYPEDQRAAMKTALENHREPTDRIPMYVNVLVVRKGSEVMLFDAGFGLVKHPDRGWLMQGLAEIGIAPEQVTAGFISHAHGDHIDGFVNPQGEPMFPNAAIYTTNEERSFWLRKEHDFSKSKRPPSWIPGMIKNAQAKFEILAPQTQTVAPGTKLFGGSVTVENGFGHTPGHALFRIQSDGESLLHIVDLVHNHVLMFQDPAWSIGLDHNPELAVAARKRVFAQAAAERTRCFGFHVSWPGLGSITNQKNGYAWIPERIWW